MRQLWEQRNPRERFMLILCLVVVAVGTPLMLTPQGAGGKKLLSAAQARREYDSLVQKKTQMDDEILRIQPAIDEMTYAKSAEDLIPEVIRTLLQYAKDSDIHLREIKPLRARRIGAITKIPLSVRFTTAFRKTVPFLYYVEDPKSRFVVEKFSVSTSDPKVDSVDVEALIALFTQEQALSVER